MSSDLLFVEGFLKKDEEHALASLLDGMTAFIGAGRVEVDEAWREGGVFFLHDKETVIRELGILKTQIVHLDDGTHSEALIYLNDENNLR